MELKTGDKVLFLNETGGGTISKIIDAETVSVLNEDGFEIPVLKSEVIVDKQWSPDSGISTAKTETVEQPVKQEPEEETPDIYYSDSRDVNLYLAVVPKNQKFLTDEGFDLYLINDSNYFLNYSMHRNDDSEFDLKLGESEPNLKIYLQSVARDKVKDDMQWLFQCIFYDNRPFETYPPLQKTVKIKAAKLFKEGAYTANDFFDEKALLIPVLEDNPMNKALEQLADKAFVESVKQKKEAPEKKKRKRIPKPELKEVDLHLHELVDDEAGMTDVDKLEHQLDRFRSEMDDALKNGFPKKIVFIHGVGGGRLKHELRRELQRNYKSCLFQDASFAEYGYGATMVLIRKAK